MTSTRFLLLGVLAAGVVCAGAAAQPSAAPWQMQESGTTAGLRGIDSVDGTIAWASGTGGTVLRTTDGGAHWQKCAIPDADKDGATLDFRGVQAWDAQTAIVMASGPGDKSRLYKTTDGCRTWKLILKNPDAPNGFFDCFRIFWESNGVGKPHGLGILLGDPVRRHFSLFAAEHGLDTWIRIPEEAAPRAPEGSGAFAASNTNLSYFGVGVDLSKFGFVTGGKAGSFLVGIAKDGRGPVWYLMAPKGPLPLAATGDGSGAFSIGEREVLHPGRLPVYSHLIVGGDYTKPNDSTGTAAWSTDGGLHWTASTTPPHGYRSTVQWSEPLRLWITAGTNGSDVSRDDGKTWQPLDNGNWNALSLPFVVGPNGRIARLAASR